ncbi:MAG: SAM-dependent methyltransferase, partial [Akkermansiaceae bacterium]
HRFLKACRDEEIPFNVLPGASAITTALVASGYPPHPFSFHGFLHVKKGKRGKQLQAALDSAETTLFFESPHRLPSTLEILSELAPDSQVCVARELTKAFETLHHGTCTELRQFFSERKVKGEIVLLIPPSPDARR